MLDVETHEKLLLVVNVFLQLATLNSVETLSTKIHGCAKIPNNSFLLFINHKKGEKLKFLSSSTQQNHDIHKIQDNLVKYN